MRLAASVLLAVLFTGCRPVPDVSAVLDGYRQIAHASYGDALSAVESLQGATTVLIEQPSDSTLHAAREAWRAARIPYSQTEALRFGNWFVDEWETTVNAWPVDEGFMDYVAEPYAASPTNPLARANLIASRELLIGGAPLRTKSITATLLNTAQGRSDAESNVATGFHAIEFLLWGQDLNENGPGQRPWTDYARDATQCTDGPRRAPLRHCQRRADFLKHSVEALRLALAQMAPVWGPQSGSYGDRLVKGDTREGLRRALFGLAAMSGAELAGERIDVALLTNAPEEEQDCFSDDTHHSLYYNALGIENFYFGRYRELRVDVSLADLARATDARLAAEIETAFATTREALQAIRSAGEQGEPFDRLIALGNVRGSALLQTAVRALQAQTALLERLGQRLELSDLDPRHPETAP